MAQFGGMKLVRKPKSAKAQYQIVRDSVRANLQPVKDEMVNARKRVVADWQHQPDFEGKVGVGAKEIFIYVTIVNKGQKLGGNNDATIGDLWKWLDKTGTKAHDIPRSADGRILVFNWGGPGSYVSKTGASPARYGGPGKVMGGSKVVFWAKNKVIKHPGFPARDFSGAINKDIKPSFDRAIDNGYRQGFKKI